MRMIIVSMLVTVWMASVYDNDNTDGDNKSKNNNDGNDNEGKQGLQDKDYDRSMKCTMKASYTHKAPQGLSFQHHMQRRSELLLRVRLWLTRAPLHHRQCLPGPFLEGHLQLLPRVCSPARLERGLGL